MNPTRRTFLVTGSVGLVALAAGGWLEVRTARPSPGHALGAAGRRIVTAMAPAFLAGALPQAAAERHAAIVETVDAVDTAIGGLPPGTQAELTQLFGLLSFTPARIVVAGLWPDWDHASPDAVEAVLARWQASRIALLRSAYDGLHQLVLAAWYGNPRAWPAIGYAGPPVLA
jgi:hypothetical protein